MHNNVAMPQVLRLGAADERVAQLAADLVEEMVAMYAGIHEAPQPLDPRIRWVLLTDDEGAPLACGGVQPLDKSVPGSPPTMGEVKRVYVVPANRGEGLGHIVMSELESWAPELGFTLLKLETGHLQPGAIALYENRGWMPIDRYGPYACEPSSVCFELSVAN